MCKMVFDIIYLAIRYQNKEGGELKYVKNPTFYLKRKLENIDLHVTLRGLNVSIFITSGLHLNG